jgi:hypothetical protein
VISSSIVKVGINKRIVHTYKAVRVEKKNFFLTDFSSGLSFTDKMEPLFILFIAVLLCGVSGASYYVDGTLFFLL